MMTARNCQSVRGVKQQTFIYQAVAKEKRFIDEVK